MPLPKPKNIAEAKARLPELVQLAARGKEIIVARNGEPQARLAPRSPAKSRMPGRGAGQWKVAEDFSREFQRTAFRRTVSHI